MLQVHTGCRYNSDQVLLGYLVYEILHCGSAHTQLRDIIFVVVKNFLSGANDKYFLSIFYVGKRTSLRWTAGQLRTDPRLPALPWHCAVRLFFFRASWKRTDSSFNLLEKDATDGDGTPEGPH